MRVAIFAGEFPILSETFVMRQVAGLIDGGHDVTVIAGKQGAGMTHEMYERYRMRERTITVRGDESSPRKRIGTIARFILGAVFRTGGFTQLKTALAAFRSGCRASFLDIASRSVVGPLGAYDAIIAHFGPVGVRAMHLQRAGLLDGPIATVFHGFDMSDRATLEKYQTAYRDLFASTSMMLPISELWANRLVGWGAPKEKVRVLRMGVDVEKLDMLSPDRPVGSPLRVLSVARFTEKKGLEYAVGGVLSAKCPVSFTIIGSGPLEGELRKLAESRPGGNTITFAGKQPQHMVFQALNEADVFLLPSVTARGGDMEGIPVALMEAMAKGVLVIATRHSGIPELIESGHSGLLVNERDAAGIATALERISGAAFDGTAMRMAARRHVADHFNNRKLDDELSALCRVIATSRAGTRGGSTPSVDAVA